MEYEMKLIKVSQIALKFSILEVVSPENINVNQKYIRFYSKVNFSYSSKYYL